MLIGARTATMSSGELPAGYIRCAGVIGGDTYQSGVDTGIAVNSLIDPIISFSAMFSNGDTDKFGTTSNAQNTILFNTSSPGTNYVRFGSTGSRQCSFVSPHNFTEIASTGVYKELKLGGNGYASITEAVPIWLNDEYIGYFNSGNYSLVSNLPLYIFKGRSVSKQIWSMFSKFDIFSKSGGSYVKVLNLIPCYRLNENRYSITVTDDINTTGEAATFFNSVCKAGYVGTLVNTGIRLPTDINGTDSGRTRVYGTSVYFSSGSSASATRFSVSGPSVQWSTSSSYDFRIDSGSVFSEVYAVGFYDTVSKMFLPCDGLACPVAEIIE